MNVFQVLLSSTWLYFKLIVSVYQWSSLWPLFCRPKHSIRQQTTNSVVIFPLSPVGLSFFKAHLCKPGVNNSWNAHALLQVGCQRQYQMLNVLLHSLQQIFFCFCCQCEQIAVCCQARDSRCSSYANSIAALSLSISSAF